MIKLSKPQWLNYAVRRGRQRLPRSPRWGDCWVDGWDEPLNQIWGLRYGRRYTINRDALLADDGSGFGEMLRRGVQAMSADYFNRLMTFDYAEQEVKVVANLQVRTNPNLGWFKGGD